MKAMKLLLTTFLFGFSRLIHAECISTIPSSLGYVLPDTLLPNNVNSDNIDHPVYWTYEWGAFARNNNKNGPILGVSFGYETKTLAEKAAIKNCKAKGGKNCRILLSYSHQCVV